MKRLLAYFRRKALDLSLWGLFMLSAVLMLKSSSDPLLGELAGTWLEPLLTQFPTGNQITFDITVGVIVSLFIYVLVVRLPEHTKRRRLKSNLRRQYAMLKEDCIQTFLWACDELAGLDLIERLKDREQFRSFFKEKVTPDQERWHAVLNGLDEYKVQNLLLELEVFRHEVEYMLNSVDIDNPEAFAFLKHLTQVLYRSKTWSDKNDQLKPLSQFMWSIHTGWSMVEGYTGRDAISEMIEAI